MKRDVKCFDNNADNSSQQLSMRKHVGQHVLRPQGRAAYSICSCGQRLTYVVTTLFADVVVVVRGTRCVVVGRRRRTKDHNDNKLPCRCKGRLWRSWFQHHWSATWCPLFVSQSLLLGYVRRSVLDAGAWLSCRSTLLGTQCRATEF